MGEIMNSPKGVKSGVPERVSISENLHISNKRQQNVSTVKQRHHMQWILEYFLCIQDLHGITPFLI